MTLAEFAFLSDENIHPEAVGFLRRLGLDVASVRELGLAGASDSIQTLRALLASQLELNPPFLLVAVRKNQTVRIRARPL